MKTIIKLLMMSGLLLPAYALATDNSKPMDLSENITTLTTADGTLHEEMVKILVSLTNGNLAPEKRNHFRADALLHAIHNRDPEMLKTFLTMGFDPNKPNEQGLRPLIEALNHTPSLKLLLSYGANPNCFNHLGFTPLMLECSSDRSESLGNVRLLINAGARVNAQSIFQEDRMTWAIYDEIRQFLGLDDHEPVSTEITPLMLAVGTPEIIRLLLAHGADASLTAQFGQTALDFANNNEVRQLLTNGITEQERERILSQEITEHLPGTHVAHYLRYREQGSRNPRGLAQQHTRRLQQEQEAERKQTMESAAGAGSGAGSSSLATAQTQSHGTKRKREDESDDEGDARGAKSARTGEKEKD